MPEQEPATRARRLIATTELARFETCQLAWWYDQTHPLAGATADELTRRLELFAAVYGPGARDLPEFHLLTHLHQRAHGAVSTPTTTKSRPALPADAPRGLVAGVTLVALLIVTLVVTGIIFSLVWH